MNFENNVVTGFVDHTESASCTHIDGLQWYSGTNGTNGNDHHSPGTSATTTTAAQWRSTARRATPSPITSASTRRLPASTCTPTVPGSVINHNVEQTGGADPGALQHDERTVRADPVVRLQPVAHQQPTSAATAHKWGDRSRTTSAQPPHPARAPFTHLHEQPVPGRELTEYRRDSHIRRRQPIRRPGQGSSCRWISRSCGAAATAWTLAFARAPADRQRAAASAPVNTVAPSLTGTATHGRRSHDHQRDVDDHRERPDRDHVPVVRLPNLDVRVRVMSGD